MTLPAKSGMGSKELVVRPSRDDDEDDLLRMQDEFMHSKDAATKRGAAVLKKTPPPAIASVASSSASKQDSAGQPARVVAARESLDTSSAVASADDAAKQTKKVSFSTPEGSAKPKKLSLFAQRRATAQSELESQNAGSSSSTNTATQSRFPAPRIESADALFGTVVSNVKERSLDLDPLGSDAAITEPLRIPMVHSSGFPAPVHRSQWRPHRATSSSAANVSSAQTPSAKTPTSGDSELDEISLENDRKIAKLSPEEIQELQQEIMLKLDPTMISFLQNRSTGKHTQASVSQKTAASDEDSMAVDSSPADATQQPEKAVSNDPFAEIDQFIDPSTAQPEKLQWMLDTYEQTAPTNTTTETLPADSLPPGFVEPSRFRFDLKGNIIDPSNIDSRSTDTSLFHHGDEPNHPGYSIQELVHLSKSTVPSQRAMSLHVLARICDGIHTERFSPSDASEMTRHLRKFDALIHIRIGLDASHESVVIYSLAAMASYLGVAPFNNAVPDLSFSHDADSLWSIQSMLRTGYRSMSLSPEALSLFAAKSLGRDTSDFELPENDGSFASISKLMAKDAVAGLLSTSMLVRFRYLLDSTKIPLSSFVDILCILTTIARHSPSSAHDILECDGLISAIAKQATSIGWPISDANLPNLKVIRDVLRLFRILCQSSRDAAAALLRYNLVDIVIRFLTWSPSNLSTSTAALSDAVKMEITALVWTILGIVFSYSLGGRLFDEYRSLIFNSAKDLHSCIAQLCDLRQTVNLQLSDTSGPQNSVRDNALLAGSAVCRTLTTLLTRYRAEMNAGGDNDAIAPFAGLVVSSFEKVSSAARSDNHNNVDIPHHIFVSAGLDFLNSYVSKSITFQFKTPRYPLVLLRSVAQILPILCPLDSTNARLLVIQQQLDRAWDLATTNNAFGLRNLLGGSPLGSKSLRRIAERLVELSSVCDATAALVEFDLLAQRHIGPRDASNPFSPIALSDSCLDLIETLALKCEVTPFKFHGEWIRLFGQGRSNLLLTWTKTASAAHVILTNPVKAQDIDQRVRRLVALSASTGICNLMPGDEYLAAEWLNGRLLSTESLNASKGQHQHKQNVLHPVLSRIYSLDLFANAAMEQSQALHWQEGISTVLRTLVIDPTENAGSLPIRRDWMFGPLDRLFDEFKTHGLTSIPDDITNIVVHVLQFIKNLSQLAPGALSHVPVGTIMVHLMKVFLLSDGAGNELFHQAEIAACLDWAFDTFGQQTVRAGISTNQALSPASTPLETGAGTSAIAFYQIYQDLVEQFAAVSFSAKHFQKYLVLPLAMVYPSDYRLAFWTMLVDGPLRSFDLTLEQIFGEACGDDVFSAFVEPVESEVGVLLAYRAAVERIPAGSFLWRVVRAHLAGHSRIDRTHNEEAKVE
eukprot:jgi/Hompol1/5851/HPOL_001022-RA